MVDVKTFDNFPYYFLLKMHCYYGKHSLKLKHYSATICARIRAIPLSFYNSVLHKRIWSFNVCICFLNVSKPYCHSVLLRSKAYNRGHTHLHDQPKSCTCVVRKNGRWTVLSRIEEQAYYSKFSRIEGTMAKQKQQQLFGFVLRWKEIENRKEDEE